MKVESMKIESMTVKSAEVGCLVVKSIAVKGKLARYAHLYNVGKPVLIYLMGNLQNIEATSKLTSIFARDYDTYIIELPGMGDTEPLKANYDFVFLAECLNDITDRLFLHHHHLFAASYATVVALEYAKIAQYKLTSQVLAAAAIEVPEHCRMATLELMHICQTDRKAFAEKYLELLTDMTGQVKRIDVIRKAAIHQTIRSPEQHIASFIENSLRLFCYRPENLNSITVPTILLTGEFDPLTTPESSRYLADQLNNGVFDIVPGTDHLLHIEDPRTLARKAVHFMQRHRVEFEPLEKIVA
ncbi:MAG: hypothetical protein COA42_05425 [Alteromonadaceae bacterium]|nr:MAG: hypothetical protein COA42_05425 [Alteromonadaceae bacterium]